MNTITRKIQIKIDVPRDNEELLFRYLNRIGNWVEIAQRISNLAVSHLFFLDQLSYINYLSDTGLKVAKETINDKGILNTSYQNTIYKLISEKFQNKIPMAVASAICQNIYKNFSKEKKEIMYGNRSLRSYRKNQPIPIPARFLHDLKFDDDSKEFKFKIFKNEEFILPFRTYLGKDFSNNRIIIDRILAGEYELRTSNLKIDDKKIFLYLTVRIPEKKISYNLNKVAEVSLSFLSAILLKIDKEELQIGDGETYVYKRHAIQSGLERRQKALSSNTGGKGRKQKLKNLEEFKIKERRFVDLSMHRISRNLIETCLENNVKEIQFTDFEKLKYEAKEYKTILRSWSYGNLLNKIEYKAKAYGIRLITN